jgi:hydroxylamine reductase
MFCRQCEQTAAGKACTTRGVCGKSAETANLQDELTGSLIMAAVKGADLPDRLLFEALYATLTNVNFDDSSLRSMISEVANCGGTAGWAADSVLRGDGDAESLKTTLLLGLRGVAAYGCHCLGLGEDVSAIAAFIRKALAAIGEKGGALGDLFPLLLECGQTNLAVMKLLDEAHTAKFGVPGPVSVSGTIDAGPFIVASGHDLGDLALLLEQSKGTGVSVYTHGEMLPARAYPELKKHSHLKGHFGTAWPEQQREMANAPGAFLFTSNCLMPPKDAYGDRVFTTGAVRFPKTVHIGPEKDFSPVIRKALDLGGFGESQPGGDFLTGFGHAAVLSAADKVVEGVKSGAIRRIFLVGGCDGARAGRSYFTDLVRLIPGDCLILTLACGKFRFNRLDLGKIGELPRLLDLGQCNDAYSAVKIAGALAGIFECGLNDLPLSLVISWYEQKAVAILLTLLSLGVKNILLGPTLPAFVSPGVLNSLVAQYSIRATTTPEEDLKMMLGQK